MKGGSGMESNIKFKDTDSINILYKKHRDDEAIIKSDLKSFYEVGSAFMRIRGSKSYKEVDGYNNFEEYCKDKWDITAAYGKRLINAVKIRDNLAPIGAILPETESQCRELSWLEPYDQREVWQMVIDSGQKITAKLIQEMVREYQKPSPEIVAKMMRERDEAEADDRLGSKASSDKGKREHTIEEIFKRVNKILEEHDKRKKYWNQKRKEDGEGWKDELIRSAAVQIPNTHQDIFKEFIQFAYRGLSNKYHPDLQGGATDNMAKLNFIKNVLMLKAR